MAGGTPLPSSPSAWLRLVKELAPPAAPHASSAFTFLQVLVGALQASRGKDAERVFNRVLLKLPEPKLGQLTEYGLLHAGSLLLALRRAGERRAGELLVKLLSLPGLPAVNPPRKTRLTCSLALCLLLVQEGEDMGEVGRLATAMVGQAVAAWGADQNNVSKKVVMKEMVSVWRKGVEEVVGASWGLVTGEEGLVGEWLPAYLSLCSDGESAWLCRSLTAVVTRVRAEQGVGLHPSALVDRLWGVVHPALRTIATHLTAPPELAELLADFVLLEAEGGAVRGADTVADMLGSMGRGVAPRIRLAFLHRLAPHPLMAPHAPLVALGVAAVAVHLGTQVEEQGRLREAWAVVTRLLEMEEEGEHDGDMARRVVVQSVRWERREVVEAVAKECTLMARKGKKVEVVGRVVRVVGWLARHATSLLPPSELSALLQHTVIPSAALAEDWRPPESAKASLALALPDLLAGLADIPAFLDNKTLRRHVADVVRIYTPVWPPSAEHPLLHLLRAPALALHRADLQDLQTCVIERLLAMAVDASKLTKTWPLAAAILALLRLALEQPADRAGFLVTDTFLPFLLDLMARRKEVGVRNPAIRLVEVMVEAVEEEELVLEKVVAFATKNLQNNYESCLEVLEVVGKLRAGLGLRLVQPVHREVTRIQKTRGSNARLNALKDRFEMAIYNAS